MNVLFWLPRILVLAFAIFLALFSLDASDNIGLLMHLIPSVIILAVALILWKYDQIAGVAFIILGIIATIYYNTYTNPLTFLFVSCPYFLIGVLYLLTHYRSQYKQKMASAS